MLAGRPSASDIMKKYSQKLESQLQVEERSVEQGGGGRYSGEYEQFLREMRPQLSGYEKWAQSIGNIISIRLAERDRIKIQKYLDDAHVDVTPSQAMTLSIMSMFFVFFGTLLAIIAYFLIAFPSLDAFMASPAFGDSVLFFFLGTVASLFVFYYTSTMPQRLANAWRLQASAQMVPAILYVVVYMKHTSNLERAIQFASQHLDGPLALDFKKVFYDVEVGKFSTVKQSLEEYLRSWNDYSPEFVEAFHLIESSLFEPAEGRRVEILERALQVILDGVYEKMLKYSREIRSPLTNLYMLGIILPTLGLALLPLASTLLGGLIRWPHVFVLFNIIIPFFVFYMVSQVLLKRPGGYGEGSMLELNPEYETYASRRPWVYGILIALPFFILGFLPFIMQVGFITDAIGLQSDYTFSQLGLSFLGEDKVFDFKTEGGVTTGPFGPLAILLSMFIPLGLAIMFYYVYSEKTRKLIVARDDTKLLEKEFANSLFQLGNRLGDGMPAELAFGRVAVSTQGQKSAQFFSYVAQNVQQGGMTVESAVFDPRRGAIIYFPSALIATSIRILIESSKKGLKIAAQSLMSISQYVKNIEKINERLRDLLAEIVSDMKSNMTFLAPLLAGIVVGLASMITAILNKLETLTEGTSTGGTDLLGPTGFQSLFEIFNLSSMIPPFFIQLSIGLYIIEIVFILTGALVTVDSGRDKLREKNELAKNLRTGIVLYLVTAFVSTLILSVLAGFALGGLGAG
jgi:Flp pilus assembly protein TadB